jgi:lipase maturation factor 1
MPTLNLLEIQSLFNSLFGIVCFFAFYSLYQQFDGLFSEKGISPLKENLSKFRSYYKNKSKSDKTYKFQLFTKCPSIFFYYYSDQFAKNLLLTCSLLSLLLLFNIFTAPVFLFLFISFLSFCSVDFDFLSFQWDTLLIEMLFIAFFYQFCPVHLLDLYNTLWILILFKLLFSSGIAKLKSGDKNWKDLTALNFHYYTQPLPNKAAYYIHQLPRSFHRFCCAVMFFIELVIPFLLFIPYLIPWAIFLLMLLQVLIFLSGNFSFFNLQTLVLCIPPLAISQTHLIQNIHFSRLSLFFSIFIFFFSLVHLGLILELFISLPKAYQNLINFLKNFKVANSYGLFAVMTTKRREIILQGSHDEKNWETISFKYKPSSSKEGLKQIAPFHPRLDWQMWFASLSSFQENPWFNRLIIRVFEDTKTINPLLRNNPFKGNPPKYIRSLLVDFTFTNLKEKKSQDSYWKLTPLGQYCPTFERKI